VRQSEDEEFNGFEICPVDWERTSLAPGMMDVAALSSGKWDHVQRRDLTTAYYEAISQHRSDVSDLATYERNIELCRLQLSIQWLGWSPHWNPPPAQAQDWLAEALSAVHALL
jgi:hypothetical protein